MKKIVLALVILIGSLYPGVELMATHGMGGEITWTCLPSGQFQFRMKFYRDCDGIPAPGSVSLTTTHPTVGTIPMTLLTQIDITPLGIPASGVGSCPSCVSGGGIGRVQESIYQSAPVTLNGVPPAAGWQFYWGVCCRSNAINNLVNPGSVGFRNRAIMYPYNGQNTNPCFDSSPYFAEKPNTIICTGYPFKYNPNAIDPELDSLTYEWGQPLTNTGTPVTFQPNYSVTSPLPSTVHNPNNIPAAIHPSTGEVTYTSFTGGYFVTVIKVTAWKCGIKVAEIFREINVVLNNSCPPVLTGQNLPPNVNAPFIDPSTGLPTSYIDTVYAGDTVNFILTATDFDLFMNGSGQTITVEASGSQFGTNFSNPNAGCIIPPCATLTPAFPTVANPLFVQSFQVAGQVTFDWITRCQHVEGLDTNCRRISNTYTFIIKATDNYCPANASNVSTISIVVLPAPPLDEPTLRCASVNNDGGVTLSWTSPTPIDTQNTFHSYEIYASLAAGGPWQLVDSVTTDYDNPASYTYTQSPASLNAMFGTNAQATSINYHILTLSGCRGDTASAPSNVLSTIKLNAALNGSNQAVLTWNALATPLLSSHNPRYLIHREFPTGSGAWTLLDSTALLTYTDVFPSTLCTGNIRYRVSLADSTGCISWSSFAPLVVNNPSPAVVIAPASPAFCQGGNVVITCSTPGATYLWSTTQVTQSITVNTAGTYTVTVTQSGGCSATGSINVTQNPNPVPVIAGNNSICQGQTTTFNAGAGPGLSYEWNTLATTQTINTGVAGNYTVTVTNANGCTGTANVNLTVNPLPVPNITGAGTFCQGQPITLNAGPGYTSYNWGAGVVSQTKPVTASGTYTVTVTNAAGCSASTSASVTINPLPVPVISGVLSFCQGSNTTLSATPGFSNYVWSNSAATQTITVSNANTFTVTVTDANNCSNSTSVTTVVNPLPTPVITGDNVICSGEITTFDAGPGYTYLWNTGALTQTVNVSTAGTYTVTVTDPNGCTRIVTRPLTVNPNPTPNITGNTTFCQGLSSNINAGGGYTSYEWNTGALTQLLSVTNNGTYTVTVTNNFNCTGSASTLVTVNPLPAPVISGILDFCQGLNTTLNAGAGYTNYQWSGGLGANQTITVNNANTYTVTVTDANGCTNSTSATTVINPNPVPVISGVLTTCNGQTTLIDAGAGYSNYNWSTGGNTQTVSVGTAGPVSVTVTDVNGCIGTANANITVFQLPSATISGIDTICSGQATSINLSFAGPGPYHYTYSDGSTSYGPFTSNLANISIPVSPTSNTNYTLVGVENNNCIGTIAGQANIRVIPLPTAILTGTTALCIGDNTNLSLNFTGVGPYTYSYTAGAQTFGPFIASSNPEIINVAPGITTTYGLTATVTGFGCVGTTNAATATVTVNPLPSASITGNNTVCVGTATDLTFNFVGTGPYTYSYSNGTNNFGPFTTPNNPHSVAVSPNVTTSYNLVSISDANCSGSVAGNVQIVVNPLPSANISGTASICDGTDTDLSILFVGTGPYTYSYNDGSNVFGPFTTNQNPVFINVSPLVNTSYGITTINDANCPGSGAGVANVTVIPLPTATMSGSTEICRGSTTNLSVNFTGVSPFEFIYTDGTNTMGPFTTNNLSTNIPVSPNNNTSYNLTFLTGAGCVGSSSGVVDIVVNAIPEAEAILSGNAVICNGEFSEFSINFIGAAPFTYSYSDGTNTIGPTTTSNNPEIIPVNPTSTSSYTLVNMSDNKCPGLISGIAQITVNPLPVATVSGNNIICIGSGTSFNIGFSGSGPYTYSYTNGTSNFGPFTTSNNPEVIQVSPLTSTSYNVISLTDANCVGSAVGVANITVNQIPSAIITGDAEICNGSSTPLNITFVGVAPFSYTYTNGTNNIGPLNTSSTSVNLPVAPATNTNYTLVAINDANCPGTISGNVDVIVNPLPVPVITGNLEICDGESSILSATPGFVSYDWSNGNTNPNINVTVGGVYGVSVSDLNGCIGSTAVNFIVNQTPVVSFTNDTSLTCEIPEINFTNNSTFPSGSQFIWDFGDNNTSFQSNPSHIFDQPGTYEISLTITSQAGCTSTENQMVDIMFFSLAEAEYTADPEVTNIFNGKVQFTDRSSNAVSWLWDFNDGDKSIEQNPSHYFNEIGEYRVTLQVTNIAGCPDSYTREIVVNPFYVPNAFTPNADGINDYFFDAGYVLDVKSYKMAIYNRWGQLVYSTNDYTKFWDGYDENNSPASVGVYVYTIDVTTRGGKEHSFKGTVSLIR